MAYNPTLKSLFDSAKNESNLENSANTTRFGRIRDIVLSEDHPTYIEYGQDALRGVHYEDIEQPYFGEQLTSLPFAFNNSTAYKGVPVIGEIVEISKKPKSNIGDSSYKDVPYYTEAINLWNNAHHNFQPDPKSGISEAFLGENVPEKDNVRTLHPFPGDVIVEGRLGQSLRFSGYSHPKNRFTDSSNNGEPFCILRVGQDNNVDSIETYTEDINKDQSSIYLTSNHSVGIVPSSTKQDSYFDEKPQALDVFKGNQVIIDSGRLVFHAKTDNILLNSKNSVGFTGGSINGDATDNITLDAPAINLGVSRLESAVKGEQNEKLLRELLYCLEETAKLLINSTENNVHVKAISAGKQLQSGVRTVTSLLSSIKSTKVFVE